MKESLQKKETKRAVNVTMRPSIQAAAARFAFSKNTSLSEIIEKALISHLKKSGAIPRRAKAAASAK